MTLHTTDVYAGRVETWNPADIAERAARLRQEHRELDLHIATMVEAQADEVAIKRLKRRKLQLKDCIARLESMLIPDEPA
ncbi:MAG: DUF465 domain-containing protein [Pseudomonas sp.]